jgi:hypothetical protein
MASRHGALARSAPETSGGSPPSTVAPCSCPPGRPWSRARPLRDDVSLTGAPRSTRPCRSRARARRAHVGAGPAPSGPPHQHPLLARERAVVGARDLSCSASSLIPARALGSAPPPRGGGCANTLVVRCARRLEQRALVRGQLERAVPR